MNDATHLEAEVIALRRRVAMLESVLDALPDPVIFKNEASELLYANSAFHEMHAVTSIQYSNDPLEMQYRQNDEVALAAKQRCEFIEESVTKDQRTITYRAIKDPVTTAAGDFGLVCVFHDITNEVETRASLHNTQSRLTRLISNIPGMVYQFIQHRDGTSVFPYVSDGVRDILHIEPEQLANRPIDISQMIHPDDRDSFRSSFVTAVKSMDSWTWEGRMLSNEGVVWVRGASRPTALPNGELLWDGLLMNISERKLIEQRLQRFMDALPIGVFVMQPSGEAYYANSAALKLLGRELIRGTGITKMSEVYQAYIAGTNTLYPTERQPIVAALRGETVTRDDIEIRPPNHAPIALEVLAAPILNEKGEIEFGIASFVDVTARKRLQNELLEAQRATMRELSSPLIPLNAQTVIMPLIGSIDAARADQIIDTLLHDVAQRRARAVIIDLTGVPVVDTHVASTLIQAAQACRLLGAEVVLTGIRPEIAQTLVSLGVDLRTVSTKSDLEAGINYAMRLR